MVSVDIAVNLAAITFNHGLEGLSPLFEQVIGFPPSAFTANYISSSDDKRSMKAGQSAQKQRRRKSQRSKELAVEERHIAGQGITYESGRF